MIKQRILLKQNKINKSSFYNVNVKRDAKASRNEKLYKNNNGSGTGDVFDDIFDQTPSQSQANLINTMTFQSKVSKDENKEPISTKRRVASISIPKRIVNIAKNNSLDIDYKSKFRLTHVPLTKTGSHPWNCESTKNNPFGFTPYDSGEMFGNYTFSDKFITAVRAAEEMKEVNKTIEDLE